MLPKNKPGIQTRKSLDSRRSNFTNKLYRLLWANRKLIIKTAIAIIKIVFRSDGAE